MIDINYELYKVFYHVASTLNFSEASKQLYISQSAVSQSIKTLERKLDQTLFIRSTKKVQLTPEGEILMRHVEPAMNLIQKGETQLLDAASTGGQIRIGASDTICRYFLIPYLERFHKAFPGAHIKVINQTSMKCAELLRNGLVDLTVVNFPNNHLGTTTSVMRIKKFRDVFIAGNTFQKLKGETLTFSQLLKYPILMLDKNSTTNEFLHQVCNEREIVKQYFSGIGSDGFEYAYLYPGMNKVLQSAGRVIRTEKDRGLILLLDERFSTGRYRELFPREWSNARHCTAESLTSYMQEFWEC